MTSLDLLPIAFGPVPSRRLGKSLGINNIPPKICTYSCVYCQLGKASENITKRKIFYQPEDIFKAAKKKVTNALKQNEKIDYITIVPDGEPTTDLNLGQEITLLKQLGLPVAIITNASLLWFTDVHQDLLKADYVSLKIDAVSNNIWRKINRPHKDFQLNTILKSIRDFAANFKGTLVTETMLIDDIDYSREFDQIATFLAELKKLNRAYIAVPSRPPAENWVKPAKEETINTAFQIFSEKLGVDRVEFLTSYEGNAFGFTGNVEEDLLGTMAVHPMRYEAVDTFLRKANSDWQLIEKLLATQQLIELTYQGNKYFMKKLRVDRA